MCGLFGGLSTFLSQNELEGVVSLGVVSSLRGVDSTGIACIKSNKVVVQKDLWSASEFFGLKSVRQAINHGTTSLVIGHCRAATLGSITVENAQPIENRNIVGVHNGTIPGLYDKDKDLSDSNVLYKILSERGLEEALKVANKGAYALVWYDAKQKTLNMIRNASRPLFTMTNTSNNSVLWASEKCMLEFVNDRTFYNNYQAPEPVPPHTLLVFDTCGTKFVPDRRYIGPEPLPSLPPPLPQKPAPSSVPHTVRSYPPSSSQAPVTISEWERELEEYDKREEEEKRKRKKDENVDGDTDAPKASGRVYRGLKYGLGYIIKKLNSGCACCNDVVGLFKKSWWFTTTDYFCDKCYRKTGQLQVYVGKRQAMKLVLSGDIMAELERLLERESSYSELIVNTVTQQEYDNMKNGRAQSNTVH